MIQTEGETVRAAQVRKGMLPCTSEASKASIPKERGQPQLQMKPEREVSQRGVPAFNTAKVSPQTRIKTIRITMQKDGGGRRGGRNCSKKHKKYTTKKQTAALPRYSCLSWR